MENFNKIIIFTISPMNKDFAKKYGVDFFNKNKISVIFLNLCQLLYGKESAHKTGWDRFEKSNEFTEIPISDYATFNNFLNSNRDGAIIYINITLKVKLLFYIFRSKIPYISGSLWGGIQTKDWSINKSIFISKLLFKVKKLINNPLKVVRGRLTNICLKLLELAHPPHLILSNSSEFVSKFKGKKNTLLNHTFDYDRFLMNKDIDKPSYIPNEKYYVLLPNHPWMVGDYIINEAKKDSAINQESYSALINMTLNQIELISGIRILVAGYPNAIPEEDIYEGRDFLLGTETEQLVKYSSGVITHFTGAINFAVIHNKPICLINYRELDKDPRFYNAITSYSKFLDLPLNYVNNEAEISNMMSKGLFANNFSEYPKYMHKFITPKELIGKSDFLFWQRVHNKLINQSKN
jgi:hypothetical protein